MPEHVQFKPDAAMRHKYFVLESFRHPAKLHCSWLLQLVETYTKPGELILDPMAGSGTLMLAALMGRDCCLVELERHFVLPRR